MARLKGHQLLGGGAAYEDRITRATDAPYVHSWWPVDRRGYTLSGIGHAVCSCGVYSAALDSGAARRRWHNIHKATVMRNAAREAGS